jgi:hypothetical protein
MSALAGDHHPIRGISRQQPRRRIGTDGLGHCPSHQKAHGLRAWRQDGEGMAEMDTARLWRGMQVDPAIALAPGAHQQTADMGITLGVTQHCQVALPLWDSPLWSFKPSEINVTVSSNRPGVAAKVTVAANLNSLDLNYQGSPITVGHGEFTATSGHIYAGFVGLRPAGWPLIGVGAFATWQDGAPDSVDLTYLLLECEPAFCRSGCSESWPVVRTSKDGHCQVTKPEPRA